MRVTKDALLKNARDLTERKLTPDPSVLAVFVVGSLLTEDPFLGGAADIDLLVLTKGEPPRERELVRLSNEIHIDIAYESNEAYAKPRELRGDPWRGWNLWDPILLHDSSRFFEYTQSSLRAQFDAPANLHARATSFASAARATWNEYQFGGQPDAVKTLQAIANAANAIASLNGPPLPERRLLAGFPARAAAAGKLELTGKLMSALGAGNVSEQRLRDWLPAWQESFETAAAHPYNAVIHPARLAYYRAAIEHHLQGEMPLAALWPMLPTWALAAEGGSLSISQEQAWQAALTELGLAGPGFAERLAALDALLDDTEELIEQLAV